MTTHWTPPCVSWGLTSDTSTDRRRPVTNTEESSWELTLVSSSEPHTNGAAKFYLPLCHDSSSGAHIRGQHAELVREPRPPPVNRVQPMPAEDKGPFQGPRDVFKKTILDAYSSSFLSLNRVQGPGRNRYKTAGPKLTDSPGSVSWAGQLTDYFPKAEATVVHSRIQNVYGNLKGTDRRKRARRSKIIKEMNKSFAFLSNHLITARKNLGLFVYLMKHNLNNPCSKEKWRHFILSSCFSSYAAEKTKIQSCFVRLQKWDEGGEKTKRDLHFFLLRQPGLSLQQKTRQKSNSSRNPHRPLTRTFFRG